MYQWIYHIYRLYLSFSCHCSDPHMLIPILLSSHITTSI
nr:MAG TPA: hypothetical protein [Caudoviricetes sp.]